VGDARESGRAPQLAYSALQAKTHDEERRRTKAQKILAVLRHFLGTDDLTGLVAVDVGSSTGYFADELASTGATVFGLDIDSPGLAHAQQRFGERVVFLCAQGATMPFADASVDIVVLNQVYEHVVDPDAVIAEIVRVLRPEGVVFCGFGNKYQVMEPHYRLPFLSWVPVGLADRYVSRFGKADSYYERFRSRRKLIEMCRPLNLWDYTYAILGDRDAFDADDVVPKSLAKAPRFFWRAFQPILPTYVWIGTPGTAAPAGPATRVAPVRLEG